MDETTRGLHNNRFEQLNASQLEEELEKALIVYLSLGSLEHHGLHMPVDMMHCVGTGCV